jgi:hypothetical protein
VGGVSGRIRWATVVPEAARIVRSYDTGVTLRQLFYRLVAAELLPNTQGAYSRLSSVTAEARRDGTFPDLIDLGRKIHRPGAFDGVQDALERLTDAYRRDRTERQQVSVYLGVEKRGLVAQLEAWFDDRGLPILALGGYTSESYCRDVRLDAAQHERPAVLLYGGDFDPSGEDILRDFLDRSQAFEEVRRVALTAEQVEEYGLPPQLGKATDSRAAAFVARHGRLVQVELDALPPDVLRSLFEESVAEFWDVSTFEQVRGLEQTEREHLEQLCETA